MHFIKQSHIKNTYSILCYIFQIICGWNHILWYCKRARHVGEVKCLAVEIFNLCGLGTYGSQLHLCVNNFI